MKPRIKLTYLLTALLGATACLSGCMSDGPSAIFNPEAVYQIAPEGAWMTDLVDDATRQRTGPIYVPPGTLLIYEPTEIAE